MTRDDLKRSNSETGKAEDNAKIRAVVETPLGDIKATRRRSNVPYGHAAEGL